MYSSFTQLSLTPVGLTLAGTVIAKRKPDRSLDIDGREEEILTLLSAAHGKFVSPRTLAYIKRAGKLFLQVQDKDWDDRTPHRANNIPVLAKAKMELALAGLNGWADVEEGGLRLRKAEAMLKAHVAPLALLKGLRLIPQHVTDLLKYNPDQPRVPAGNSGGGQWTDGGGDSTSHMTHEDYVARKQKFVDAHLAATEKVAAQLNVPVENLLGLAALESEWGDSNFAKSGKNFFGLYYPAPYGIPNDFIPAANNPNARMATFSSYEDSLQSFVYSNGNLIDGKADPVDFMTSLQNSGKFGINTDTGEKMPTYVQDSAATIRGLRSIIAPTKAIK